MLKLFQSIFSGGAEQGRYPESLIEEAIERAVDGTDPRLRLLPGYRKRLRAPVIHAIDHVVALVDSLPAPLSADSGDFGGDARLATLFASADHMREVLGNDAALSRFREDAAGQTGKIIALLLAERENKNILGMDLTGDVLRRDVAQVAVSFGKHRLVDPAASEEETRRQLKRRAFDHLLSLALVRIVELQEERVDLNRQRNLLQRKLRAQEQGGWSFEETPAGGADPAALQAELDGIEGQLAALGADDRILNAHLDVAAALLADAERQFWLNGISLRLDRMNILRDAQDASARELRYQELHNSRGRSLVIALLSITLDELPERVDFFTAAQRALA
jgi:hypothetical protein